MPSFATCTPCLSNGDPNPEFNYDTYIGNYKSNNEPEGKRLNDTFNDTSVVSGGEDDITSATFRGRRRGPESPPRGAKLDDEFEELIQMMKEDEDDEEDEEKEDLIDKVKHFGCGDLEDRIENLKNKKERKRKIKEH